MKEKNKIILPFGEVLKRSILYFFRHQSLAVKVSVLWFAILIFEAGTGFQAFCSDPNDTKLNGVKIVSSVLILAASMSILVNYIRALVNKHEPETPVISFGKREIKIVFYWFLLLFVLILGIVVFGAVAHALLGKAGSLVALLAAVVSLIFFARFWLFVPAVSVDDQSVTIAESWRLTAGNANKIFWGLVILLLPIVLLMMTASTVYYVAGADGFVGKLVYSAVMLFLSFTDSCLKASFYGHVYQYFIYFRNQKEDTEEKDKNAIGN